jgi:hypothetical protein
MCPQKALAHNARLHPEAHLGLADAGKKAPRVDEFFFFFFFNKKRKVIKVETMTENIGSDIPVFFLCTFCKYVRKTMRKSEIAQHKEAGSGEFWEGPPESIICFWFASVREKDLSELIQSLVCLRYFPAIACQTQTHCIRF